MPVTKQAAKKMRRDRRRQGQNQTVRRKLERVVKAARRKPGPKTISLAFRTLDKAAKLHIIHRNQAARLKSRLSKLLKVKKA